MTVVVKAENPAHILAAMPALVGFTPRESLVLMAFRGKRTCGAFRMDLPRSSAVAVQKRMVTSAVGILCKLKKVDSVVVVICTDGSFAGGSTPPLAGFAQLVGRRLRDSGFAVRDSLCLASDGWSSYLEGDTPYGGFPLSDLDAVSLPPGAVRPMPAERVADASESERLRVRADLVHLRTIFEEDADGAELDLLQDIPLLMEMILDCNESTICELSALLLFAWRGPQIRDLTMVQWASDLSMGDQILEEADRFARTREVDMESTSGKMMMGIGPRPSVDRIERGIDILLAVVSRADDPDRPAPLCMLAWLTWALGLTSHAHRFAQEALTIDPGYGLAELLSAMFNHGMLPEWAFAAAEDSGRYSPDFAHHQRDENE
jgi:hypothetical protein